MRLKNYQLNGSISFVPLCNPYGTNQKIGTYSYGRFNPVTGNNWNRNFFDLIENSRSQEKLQEFVNDHKNLSWEKIKQNYKSFLVRTYKEYRSHLQRNGKLSDNITLNLLLQEKAAMADGILDLHTGPVATRYLYAPEYAVHVASELLFKK